MTLVLGLKRVGKDQEADEGILPCGWARAKNNERVKRLMNLDGLFKQKWLSGVSG
jgi:hypothetical protein